MLRQSVIVVVKQNTVVSSNSDNFYSFFFSLACKRRLIFCPLCSWRWRTKTRAQQQSTCLIFFPRRKLFLSQLAAVLKHDFQQQQQPQQPQHIDTFMVLHVFACYAILASTWQSAGKEEDNCTKRIHLFQRST